MLSVEALIQAQGKSWNRAFAEQAFGHMGPISPPDMKPDISLLNGNSTGSFHQDLVVLVHLLV